MGYSKVTNIIGSPEGRYVVEEIGALDFAVQFLEAINKLYDAIGYIPPHGDKSSRQMTLLKTIENIEYLDRLLQSMQRSLEERFPTRHSFTRAFGSLCSSSIKCVTVSVEGLKALAERLNYLSPGLHLSVYPHAAANECLVERAFGFTMKK